MPVFIAICLFLVPIIGIGGYMIKEYEFDYEDFRGKWYISRITAIITFALYALYILFSGYLNEFLNEIEFYFIYPSLAFASIVFAQHFEWGNKGDYMHFLGWIVLVAIVGWLFIEETMIYT